MFSGRLSDHEQQEHAHGHSTSVDGLQHLRLNKPANFGGAWSLPQLGKGIPDTLSAAGALAPRHLAAFALASAAHGVSLPSGKFTTAKATVQRQWTDYIAEHCGRDDFVRMHLHIGANEERVGADFGSERTLNTFRLKSVVERLNSACPGMGWFVFNIIEKASDGDYPIFDMREYGGMMSYMWFHDSWNDEEAAEAIRDMEGLDEATTIDEIRDLYDRPWPSDAIASVDGQAWMYGRWAVARKAAGAARRPKAASLQEASQFLQSRKSRELRDLVHDALNLREDVVSRSNPLKSGDFRPTAKDCGLQYMDPDEHPVRLGATCFICWDKPTLAWEAVSHWEQHEMEGSEITDTFYHLEADPNSPNELASLVTRMQAIVRRHNLVSRVLRHFPME